MTLDVHLFPCLSDNYGLLVRDRATGAVAAIDTPDADRILEELSALGWGPLGQVLNTHWHPDHTGGNAALKAATGCTIRGPAEVRRAAPLDHEIRDGDSVQVGDTRLDVIAAPGHTLGHVVFHDPEGRTAWPDETVIWCGHEYTAANARFALSVDDRPELRAHVEALRVRIDAGQPTVPTTLGDERRFNPFLTAGDAATFAERRAAKDDFRG